MNNYPVLSDTLAINAIIDTEFFNRLLLDNDQNAISILKYDGKRVTYFKTDYPSTVEDILKIPSIHISPPEDHNIKFYINLTNPPNYDEISFDERIIQHFLNEVIKRKISELPKLSPLFAASLVNKPYTKCLYITDDELIQKNMVNLSKNLNVAPFYIVDLYEFSNILNLFYKKQNLHYIGYSSNLAPNLLL